MRNDSAWAVATAGVRRTRWRTTVSSRRRSRSSAGAAARLSRLLSTRAATLRRAARSATRSLSADGRTGVIRSTVPRHRSLHSRNSRAIGAAYRVPQGHVRQLRAVGRGQRAQLGGAEGLQVQVEQGQPAVARGQHAPPALFGLAPGGLGQPADAAGAQLAPVPGVRGGPQVAGGLVPAPGRQGDPAGEQVRIDGPPDRPSSSSRAVTRRAAGSKASPGRWLPANRHSSRTSSARAAHHGRCWRRNSRSASALRSCASPNRRSRRRPERRSTAGRRA